MLLKSKKVCDTKNGKSGTNYDEICDEVYEKGFMGKLGK